jgi:cytochrome c
VRFPEPVDANGNGDPQIAVREGHEIQIDDVGAPDGEPVHQTGAIYNVCGPSKVTSKQPGEWNTFVIRVRGQIYVTLNDEAVANFKGNRSPSGYIGLQNHSVKSQVLFRNIAITPL